MNTTPQNTTATHADSSPTHLNQLTQEQVTDSNTIQIPSISLPKGGGALKGIDEKFEVNAANGTAGFSIPLPITPGRNGFNPSLSLSYNSGSGNSPYGLGWSVDYPMIQRKTDKQLPRYRDGLEEDVFMFSGAEDLVPFLLADGTPVEKVENDYTIKRYRPRVEGGFARIEQITHVTHGSYWKVTTRENVTTIFGRSKTARVTNPTAVRQVFQWMPEFSYDDKGNWIKYEYKAEDSANVPTALYEKNRLNGTASFTNLYLKRVQYGNHQAYYPTLQQAYDPSPPANEAYFFELVMDYGEHQQLAPTPTEEQEWEYRSDAFSSYRSGFEIRTNRWCKRILLFHHFEDKNELLGYAANGVPIQTNFGKNYLVRSLDLTHTPSSINQSGQSETTYLTAITQSGYIRLTDNTYTKKSLPPLEFTYEQLQWNQIIKTVDSKDVIHAPVGLTNNYQWVDLYGEGIAGILSEQAEGWYYKSNLGDVDKDGQVAFTLAQSVAPKPSYLGLANGLLSLQDLEANGKKQIVVQNERWQGFFELTADHDWQPFQPFSEVANLNLQDPNLRLIDLNGDGQPDLVITEENVFTWYAANGKKGHHAAEYATKPFDEEQGPAIVFADQEQTIFLADMSGDGLTDIVRIRNGEICYWANMGYGKFSAKVNMANAPLFDHDDLFNPQYLHLADVSGTGATDIIYLGQSKFKAFINLSGNAWSEAHEIEPFFPIDGNTKLSVIDLLGTGTSCIVWSSDLPAYAHAPMRYIDLMNSKKPHVLTHYKNNLGKETYLQYKSSTHFYLEDKLAGKPWVTKLPFPVQVISKMIVEEKITDVRFTSQYRYHHGYYDHPEREFRGFGMVEQIDTENYEIFREQGGAAGQATDAKLFQPPVRTKTWFHTGAFLDETTFLQQFSAEYWYNDPALPAVVETDYILPNSQIVNADQFTAIELREAYRACKGMMLRQEIFSEEGDELQQKIPHTVATHNCHVQLLQKKAANQYAVFLNTESEAITFHYEKNHLDPRIAHNLNIKIDELGNVLESAAVVYGRNAASANNAFAAQRALITNFSEDVLRNDDALQTQLQNAFDKNLSAAEQAQVRTHIIYTQNTFAKFSDAAQDIDLPHVYRLRLPYETQTFELHDATTNPANQAKATIFEKTEIETLFNTATAIDYHRPADTGKQKRLIEHIRTRYLKDDLTPLDFTYFDTLALPYENYQLAYQPSLIEKIYKKKDTTPLAVDGTTATTLFENEGRYTKIGADLWIRSGISHFATAGEDINTVRQRFFMPIAFEDPFGARTTVQYDEHHLFIQSTEDAVKNKVQIDIFNYRTLSPQRMIDLNANPSSVLLDELGLVKAVAMEGNGKYVDDDVRTTVQLLQPADTLAGLTAYTERAERDKISDLFAQRVNPITNYASLKVAVGDLIQGASVRFIYDFTNYQNHGKPTVVASFSRENHFNTDTALAPATRKYQIGFEYSDGLGKVAMTKAQAEPATGSNQIRWIGNGRMVLNNKGNPVKQYEPYFSNHFGYEDEAAIVEQGVTPILYYDALGRLLKTEFPDGTLSKVQFTAWEQRHFDQNDTVLDTECIWYQRRTDNTRADFIADPVEQQAAAKAANHANTPSMLYLDSLGRPVLSIADNGADAAGKKRLYTTFIDLDIEGNARRVVDARGNVVMTYQYNMLGQRVYQDSMDGGERWMLNNVMGNPLYVWDSREQVATTEYDPKIQRPIKLILIKNGNRSLIEKFTYGDEIANAVENNLLGQIAAHWDASGQIRNVRYDFKGGLQEVQRRLAAAYDAEIVDWTDGSPTNRLEAEIFTSFTEYDALGRMTRLYNWHSNLAPVRVAVYEPTYNERGVLQSERQIIGATLNVVNNNWTYQNGTATTVVSEITYNEKGQRTKMHLGNGTTTRYHYDAETFRLQQLRTTRNSGSVLPQTPSNLADPNVLQNLYYAYDPVGNITEIEDDAFEPVFFRNQQVEPKSKYTYDATYRLIVADGRENQSFNTAPTAQEPPIPTITFPKTDKTLRNYTQKYTYDPVGNILRMRHQSPVDSDRWTRTYQYVTDSNRLLKTWRGSNEANAVNYRYDAHGSMLNYINTPNDTQWDYRDMMQQLDLGGGGKAYYQYDTQRERSRKRIEKGNITEERLYLGGMEVYRRWSGGVKVEEIETFHVFVDDQRILLVEDVLLTDDAALGVSTLHRYQYSNHLGSVGLEMDAAANIISYEEYHPYGTVAYQATNSAITAKAKRYRYTGMERDEESGLSYHSARYYMAWLGRWMKVDPIGIEGGNNLYLYSLNNPITNLDRSGYQASGLCALGGPTPWCGAGIAWDVGVWLLGGTIVVGSAITIYEVAKPKPAEFSTEPWNPPIAEPEPRPQPRPEPRPQPRPEPGPGPIPIPPIPDGDGDDDDEMETITVYRVQDSDPLTQRVAVIQPGGYVSIEGDDTRVLWLNFGERERAEEFARRKIQRGRTGVTISSFDVPLAFYIALRASAVEESESKGAPNSPIISRDPPRGTQLGLRESQIQALRAVIIQGTGNVEEIN